MRKRCRTAARNQQTLGKYAASDGESRGLYLWVRTPERRIWTFRYTLNGKAHEMALGSLAQTSLADARAVARQLRAHNYRSIERRRSSRADIPLF